MDFKIPSDEKVFFENFNNFLKSSKINFNTSTGHLIILEKHNLNSESYKILFDKHSVTIHYSDYAGKFYAIITLIQLINFYKTNLPLGFI